MAENIDETRPVIRLAVVAGFIALCLTIFAFLWVNSGGRVPLAASGSYEVTATVPRVSNAVYFSDVMVAGVKIGKVRGVEEHGDRATVELELNEDVAPLHEGATFEVRAKSLIEESFISITDGDGVPIDSGHVFGIESAKAPVQLDDVLDSLDPATRASLTSVIRSSAGATKDSRAEVASAMEALGRLGREGGTALDALADQSRDLESLTRSSTRVLAALAQRREQLSTLVANADRVTAVTAGQEQDLADTIGALPPLLDSAHGAADDVTTLARHLDPVAHNLDAAAGDLSAALAELPATSADLRGLLPSLDGVLVKAPGTLQRVPTLSSDVEALLPAAEAVLAELNPVLGYMGPYGKDLAAWFTNFAQTVATGDRNGRAFRVMGVFNEQSLKGIPLNTNIGPLDKFNPLPAPGSAMNPGPSRGTYPHVTRDRVPKG